MAPDTFQKVIKFIYYRYLWWTLQVFPGLVAILFMGLGVYALIFAYRLKNPVSFVLCFFASNLMILAGVVLLIGFIYRIVRVYQRLNGKSMNKKN